LVGWCQGCEVHHHPAPHGRPGVGLLTGGPPLSIGLAKGLEWARRGGLERARVISIATEKTGELKDCNGTDDDDRDYKNDDDSC